MSIRGKGTEPLVWLSWTARRRAWESGALACTSLATTRGRWSCTGGAGTRSRTVRWRKTCRNALLETNRDKQLVAFRSRRRLSAKVRQYRDKFLLACGLAWG